jgi:hypothetical protein
MTAVTSIELAKQWATAEDERTRLQTALEKAKLDLDNVRIRQEGMVKDLRAGVGANVPQKFYDLGDGRVVMVSIDRGVQLVVMERAYAPK